MSFWGWFPRGPQRGMETRAFWGDLVSFQVLPHFMDEETETQRACGGGSLAVSLYHASHLLGSALSCQEHKLCSMESREGNPGLLPPAPGDG